ncbi:MAG: hypothetical protein A2Y12_12875 [Planctomycetes bacterium GWF2_42_9]|nr:MAG: hypothetical protein A2Y12_12875 [Planctomycetes bacterium GWF2_42_9]
MSNENQNPVRKNSKIGIIGFILVIVGYIFAGAMTLFPGLIICIIAFFRKSNRFLAVIGVLLCLFWLVYLEAPDLLFPNPYGLTKFANNLDAKFWLWFEPLHLKNAQGAYWFFGGGGGALYFSSNSSKYNSQDVVAFAEKHGWKYESQSKFSTVDFNKLVDAKNKVRYLDIEDYLQSTSDYDVNDFKAVEKVYESEKKKADILRNATMYTFPLWICSDCDVLLFNTDNHLPSPVFISSDGKSLAIYYNGVR